MANEAPHPREQELFAQAAELADAAARDGFLRRACGGDAVLLARLQALLAAHEAATAFLPGSPRRPPGPVPDAAPHDQPTLADPAAQARARPEEPGDVIGRYRLLERLGAGGMGEVFLAEQREPVVRQVALKVIKLGMDTREVVARFEAERQALALMDHPCIARVFDAGATANGRPYFVMEHVAGAPITRFCDEQRLDLRRRLGLFVEVCSAVQHAHQKGVIHRDLKPSNVLVAAQGDRPLPKVIDFGIAKATQEPLTDLTLVTRPHHLMGTPAYMSPEQAGLGALDVDTRSDIYSLGVLLYELLTGTLPFDPRATGLDVVELLRLIRQQDPPLPSARVRSFEAAALAAFRERRGIEVRDPHRLLAGDLDWITARALEKDRARRYETANALAQDIRRFLADEPVAAAAPSRTYRLAKFVRRHRLPVAAAAVILLLLAVGVTVTTWLAVEANRARREAVREAENRGAVARFLEEMLDAASPARARGRDTALLKEILDGTAVRLAGELGGQPGVRHQLSRTIGRTYEAIGSVSNALAMQETALALAAEIFGPAHPEVARAHLDLGLTLHRAGQYGAASNAFAAALGIAARPGGEARLAAQAGFRLGSLASALGHPAEAERLLLGARAVLRGRPGTPDLEAITCDSELAALYYRQGRLAEMEPLVLAVVADRRRLQGDDHPSTLNDLTLLALLRQAQGGFAEAEAAHREIVATRARILGEEHPFTLTSRDHLALVLGVQGRHAEAEAISRAILPPFERQFGLTNRDTLALRSNLAEHLRNQGQYAEAERLFRETMAVQAGLMAETDPFRLETQNGLAVQFLMQQRLAEAEELTRAILEARRASLPADDPALGDALAQLTLVLLAQRRHADAEAPAREALAIRNQGVPDDWRRFVALSQWGAVLLGLGRPEEAGPPLREGHEGLLAQEARLPAVERARLHEAGARVEAHAAAAR